MTDGGTQLNYRQSQLRYQHRQRESIVLSEYSRPVDLRPVVRSCPCTPFVPGFDFADPSVLNGAAINPRGSQALFM